LKNIMALIDGSIYAKSVCDHAAWLSQSTEAAIDLVHVLGRRETQSDLSGSIGLGARTALLEELSELDAQKSQLAQKRGRLLLDEASNQLTSAGVEQIITRLRHGDVVETVQALENEADVIVIGKRGEAADFARLHLGSNLERVVRSTTKPVLVASRAFKPIERVLIAYDGGESAKKAIGYIAGSPVSKGKSFTLLTVGTETPENQQSLKFAAKTLTAAGLEAECLTLQGQADIVIAAQIESGSFDLLAMGAYGHSRIRNLIIGSTTTEMIRFALVPVLLFR